MERRAMGLVRWRELIAVDPRAAQERARDAALESATDLGAFLSVADPGSPLPQWRARGLKGMPFAVKDNIDTASLATTGGSAVLDGSLPRADAGVVRSLLDEGAWVVGKTNLHELALGVTSENGAFADVRNPYDPGRSAGGSSGGSAVAVAVGAAAFSLGTDTGGSMTIPAACCGVVGYRPTRGRYPVDGLLSISWTRDSIGVMAASVADVIAVDAAVTGRRPSRSRRRGPLHLGVPQNRLSDLDDDVADAIVDAFSRLEGSGLIELHEVSTASLDARAFEHGFAVVAFEAPRTVEAYLSELRPPYSGLDLATLASGTRSGDVKALLDHMLADPIGRDRYRRARDARDAVQGDYRRVVSSVRLDALLYPTIPARPPMLGEGTTMTHRARTVETFPTLTRHTEAGAFAGNPSISVPAGCDRGGLPVGLTVEGLRGTDDRLLEVADMTESALTSTEVLVPIGER
ncbi:amidase family protein [Streptomyces sp. NPDC004296]|uniref:amidase family protein n=1 Tax=Streptomyces sp. NPDC004296 TaxID=3364697 RepID=UPI00369B4DC4